MSYTAYEVADIAGVPYRTLMRWVEAELLHPEGGRSGHGKVTHWEAKHAREASVLGALRKAGMTLKQIGEAMAYLRTLGHNPFSTGEFLAIRSGEGKPADILKFCDSGEVLHLLQDRQQGVFPLWTPEHPTTP